MVQREVPLVVGEALEVDDPIGDPLGVLHLVDRLVAVELGETLVAPVRAQLAVEEVLVHRREFGRQHLVEHFDDLRIALHVAKVGHLRDRCHRTLP